MAELQLGQECRWTAFVAGKRSRKLKRDAHASIIHASQDTNVE